MEVLISVFIIGLIFTLIFLVFFNIIEGKRRAENLGETYQSVRTIFRVMENDIKSAVLLKHNPSKTRFLGEDAEETDPMDRLRFNTIASSGFAMDMVVSDQRLVEYITEYDSEHKQVILFRNESLDLDEELLNEENRVPIGFGLRGLNLRYYSEGRWLNDWDSYESDKIPKAVEIELILDGVKDEKRSFFDLVMIETDQKLLP